MSATLPTQIEQLVPSGTLSQLLQATIEHFDCQAGTLHVRHMDVLHLSAAAGIPAEILHIVQAVPIGKGIAGLAAERKEPITICNLQTDASGQARPGAKATGMEGSLAVPMISSKGELYGVLGIAKAAAHNWSAEETYLLSTIATAIADRETAR